MERLAALSFYAPHSTHPRRRAWASAHTLVGDAPTSLAMGMVELCRVWAVLRATVLQRGIQPCVVSRGHVAIHHHRGLPRRSSVSRNALDATGSHPRATANSYERYGDVPYHSRRHRGNGMVAVHKSPSLVISLWHNPHPARNVCVSTRQSQDDGAL